MSRLCVVCSKKGNKICGKCFSQYYCSKECQAEDWKIHKLTCQQKKPKPRLPQTSLFNETDLILGYSEEDEVFFWLAFNNLVDQMLEKQLMELKILVLNGGTGNAKIMAKSPLLTSELSSTRKKVSSKIIPKFIELNGKSMESSNTEDQQQVILGKNEHSLFIVGFDLSNETEIKNELNSLVCLEIPVKIDSKGVVKIKIHFDHQVIKHYIENLQQQTKKQLSTVD